MQKKWYEALIVRIENVSSNTRIFYLDVQTEECFTFLPGQFITIDLPISEKRRERWRSYSIANAPNKNNKLELCIVNVDDGKGTDYLFSEVNVGSKLKFKGPSGSFVLPTDLNRDLVLICTGTGVAPFRSMMQEVSRMEIDYRKIHLIFGTRYSKNILYLEEFQTLLKSNLNFSYDVCLSKEKMNEDWPSYFHEGRVHQIYQKKYKLVDENRLFLVCGWTVMIDEAVENLKEMKYESEQIKLELYG